MKKVKILYIIGPTRSGSTLLARLLNEYPGVVGVGEVVSLDVALQSSRMQAPARGEFGVTFVPSGAVRDAGRNFSALCGCTLPLQHCPIWADVEASAFGDPPDYSPWSWDSLRPSAGRLVLEGAGAWLERSTRALGEVAECVYRELARLTEASVIVDESKTPLYGYFLNSQRWADVVPVRLVRDPRGTALSWREPKPYPGVQGGHLPAHSARAASVDWLKRVVLADRLFRHSPVVRYEDLVVTPTKIVRRLLDSAGLAADLPTVVDTGGLTCGTNHILAGNPDKFERGQLRIRPPSNWSEALPRGARWSIAAATFPLLRRYGYAPWKTPPGAEGSGVSGTTRVSRSPIQA
jgi:hypothetical protein